MTTLEQMFHDLDFLRQVKEILTTIGPVVYRHPTPPEASKARLEFYQRKERAIALTHNDRRHKIYPKGFYKLIKHTEAILQFKFFVVYFTNTTTANELLYVHRFLENKNNSWSYTNPLVTTRII